MSHKGLSLLRSIFLHIKFYSLANFFGKGANFFIFLLIAKIFSVEEFAEYITLMVVIELLLVLLLFGVDSHIMRSQGSFAFDLTLEFIKFNLILRHVPKAYRNHIYFNLFKLLSICLEHIIISNH